MQDDEAEESYVRQKEKNKENDTTVCNSNGRWLGKNQVFLDLEPSVISAVDVLLACPPTDPGRLSVKLLGTLVPQDILARSNCTEAKGREIVNPKILQAIKGEYCCVLNVYNLLFFPSK